MQITEQIKAKEEKKGVWYQLLPRTTLFDSDASLSTFLLNSRVELVVLNEVKNCAPKRKQRTRIDLICNPQVPSLA